MNIEQLNTGSLTGELKVTLDPIDYNETYETALKTYRKRVDLPGFRKGAVPASLVKQRFGKSLLVDEINKMLQDAIGNYVSENKLELLGSPIPKEGDDVGDWICSNFRFEFRQVKNIHEARSRCERRVNLSSNEGVRSSSRSIV